MTSEWQLVAIFGRYGLKLVSKPLNLIEEINVGGASVGRHRPPRDFE